MPETEFLIKCVELEGFRSPWVIIRLYPGTVPMMLCEMIALAEPILPAVTVATFASVLWRVALGAADATLESVMVHEPFPGPQVHS